MKIRGLLFNSAISITICLHLFIIQSHLGAQDSMENSQIRTIYKNFKEGKSSANKIESEYLELLKHKKNPKTRGKINVYLSRVYYGEVKQYHQKVVQYSQEASKHDLAVLDACEMYKNWGDALQIKKQLKESKEKNIPLDSILIPYLKSFALLIDSLKIDTLQSPPFVGKLNIEQSDPQYNEFLKEYENQVYRREYVLKQNRLLHYRNTFKSKIINLSGDSSVFTNKKFVMENLRCGNIKADEVIKELLK